MTAHNDEGGPKKCGRGVRPKEATARGRGREPAPQKKSVLLDARPKK